jgi:hypothetical protein
MVKATVTTKPDRAQRKKDSIMIIVHMPLSMNTSICFVSLAASFLCGSTAFLEISTLSQQVLRHTPPYPYIHKDGVRDIVDSPSWMTTVVAASFFTFSTLTSPLPAMASMPTNDDAQGISIVTQSELGRSIRKAVIGGAQMVDQVDLKWERFSDSLRDEAKCDPRTNRRMFDNGFRRDGTRIGNPVLGALCSPEPLRQFDANISRVVRDAAKDATLSVFPAVDVKAYDDKVNQVQRLVGPSFARAVSDTNDQQSLLRQAFNQDLYVELRAIGELTSSWTKEAVRAFHVAWGEALLTTLAPNTSRENFISPFPKPDDADNQPYDEGSLLDALGRLSVALTKLQGGGLIGHWEISIPEDDDWSVVTIAIDDDISIGGQILGKERGQPLDGSAVNAMVRAAMDRTAKISFKMDVFFIDPTTTKQDLYNPSQLLISLSDLGQ